MEHTPLWLALLTALDVLFELLAPVHLVEHHHQLVDPEDRSFLYGDALFETVRVTPRGIRWLSRHVARLRRSGEILGFKPSSIDEAVRVLEELPSERQGIWRVTVSRLGGEVPFGGTGCVRTRWRPAQKLAAPTLTALKGYFFPGDLFAEHKTTSYGRKVFARYCALQKGFDDALLLSPSGLLGEATTANVVVVEGSKAFTPPVDGILPGVTREGLLDTLRGTPYAIEELPIESTLLDRADEICLLSAGVGLLCAQALQGRALKKVWGSAVEDQFLNAPDASVEST